MCGICGFVGPDPLADGRQVVQTMADLIVHRGPDGEGFEELRSRSTWGWLGHRRLTIIDLTTASSQPMKDPQTGVLLSYNGELYNFRELRRELQHLGQRFVSAGDTEVVLRSYLAWGTDAFARFEGMFALAVWDPRRDAILLARDRTGKKPLFLRHDGRWTSFASELKSLLVMPGAPRAVDRGRLGEFLLYGYVPHPATLLEGYQQVPPAHYLEVGAMGPGAPVRYWSPLPGDVAQAPDAAWQARTRQLFFDAVGRRVVADVPVGAFLSGGIDSSLVVAALAAAQDEPVRTFSIGFPEDASFDETPYARSVAKHFGAEHTEFSVEVDAVALLDRLVWHHDQPFADSSAIPTFMVSERAREHVKVVLSGDGGDEVFGGYDRFVAAKLSQRVPGFLTSAVRSLSARRSHGSGYFDVLRRLDRFAEAASLPLAARYLRWIAVFDPEAVRSLVGAEDESASDATLNRSMEARYGESAHLPPLDRILFANVETYLPDDLHVKVDRMSMAHGLEVRSPFLDAQLIEHVARVPAARKVGWRRPKPLLKRSLAHELPADVWNRPKHGFGVPMNRWFEGELGDRYADEVLATGARTADLLDGKVAAALLRDHRSQNGRHGPRMWSLLTLERWLRTLDEPARPLAAAGIRQSD